jgi:hypothetical protein
MYIYISRDFVGDIIIHSVSTMLIYFSTLRFPSTPITPPQNDLLYLSDWRGK